jgi:vacuolar-type H+-ATPase subunit B/Vma2
MKSAIGEKLTRKDHGDVSNQLVSLIFFIITAFSTQSTPSEEMQQQ